jgi:hypothetical protein
MLFQGEYDPLALPRSRRETATTVATRPATLRKRTNMQRRAIRLAPDESRMDATRTRPSRHAPTVHRLKGGIGQHPITGAPVAIERHRQ